MQDNEKKRSDNNKTKIQKRGIQQKQTKIGNKTKIQTPNKR